MPYSETAEAKSTPVTQNSGQEPALDHGEQNDLDLCLSSEPSSIRMALARLIRRLAYQEIAPEALGKVELVLAEVMNNIVEHALEGKNDGIIHLKAEKLTHTLAFEVSDSGNPMPNGQLPRRPMPITNLDIDSLPEGGFGWPLIHTLTDAIGYEYNNGMNVLKFSIELDDSLT